MPYPGNSRGTGLTDAQRAGRLWVGSPPEPMLTAWAFLLFVLAVVGLCGLVLWRVTEAALLRLG